MDLVVFDFDAQESWRKVRDVLNQPLAIRALAAGMNARCQDLEEQWTPELGPWQLAERKHPEWPALEALSPTPDSPDWYRILGHCNAIAPWCAAIGRLLYPDHEWMVWYNYHFQRLRPHSAGIGFRDDRRRSVVIMDILMGRQTLRRKAKWKLMKQLTAPTAFCISIEEAIEHLEAKCREKARASFP